ncbi:DNA-formamidopyrimidine glycosylase [Caldibacillus sp. 210928-DFI.2.22]|uniref:DNA-formamidopyrimidine glycosylase n=1 Tax=Bacillaceae TaxID=186817 RepID=UPI001D06BF71|nr:MULTISPECIES: DNA-formamidopyrimidine glycosylase [unclassified Caldibacillus]MCB7069317.1 DNA-formamidopyrimidine glycosylase [Caldibacillus sp. 210928-DFI.2.22]MCB7072742.1 DNA-formamidopyrimidine glycosylase [Caldibacillus sp. 210928-DFI.2.18]
MPELPEVETIKRTLEAIVLGKTIEDVKVFWPKIIKNPPDVEEFIVLLKGQTIRTMGRRGKFLIFYMNDVALVSHLRMEGKYGLYPKEEPFDKHTHVIFSFTDGTELRYRDVRKFGTMHIFPIGEEMNHLPLSQLGPEPFAKEFTTAYFAKSLAKTARMIKPVLLDQTIVTGLGNIYVDEALYRAKIHPERLANSLSKSEVKRLIEAIIATLTDAVEKGGSTIRSYVNSQGQIGMFQLELNAYAQEGKPCKNCGTPIEKIKVGGRGTHFCPNCQKVKI